MPIANKSRGKGREVRQSRSRNTTPRSGLSASTTTASSVPGYLDNDLSKLFQHSAVEYSEILDQLGGGGTIPESKTLELLTDHLKTLSKLADSRGDICNAGMRELSQRRKDVLDVTSPSSKKARNLASGSTSSLSPPSMASPLPAKDGEDGDAAESPSSDSSDDTHQPEPAPTVPHYQVFGPDPLKFDDPTIYHIREVTPGMSDEERKEIYSVARFPRSDLTHMMAGQPPDKDFSSAKPTNQVSANTFTTYIEAFVRPLTEEDIAFLKEKVPNQLR
jgi:transcriptional adapter 3